MGATARKPARRSPTKPASARAKKTSPRFVARLIEFARRHQDVLSVTGIFLCSRLFLVVSSVTFPNAANSFAGFVYRWIRWDANHYLHFAENGYSVGHRFAKFPPLYPFLVRLWSTITFLPLKHAGILLTLICFLAASWLLFVWMRKRGHDRAQALWAVAFLNFFPAAHAASSVYSEPLFLVFLCLYFLNLSPKGYRFSSMILSFAVLQRTMGVFLFPVHLYRYYLLRKSRMSDRPGIGFAALPLLIFAAHQAILFIPLRARGYLERMHETGLLPDRIPGVRIGKTFAELASNPALFSNADYMLRLGWNCIGIVAATIFLFCRRRDLIREEKIFCFFYVALMYTMPIPNAAVRFLWVLLPLYPLLATIRSSAVKWVLLGLSAVGLYFCSQEFFAARWAFG